MDILTKKEFWDPIAERHPKAMEAFMAFVDRYKQHHRWPELFNENVPERQVRVFIPGPPLRWEDTKAPKFHDLPTAMQFGIFLEFVSMVPRLKFTFFLHDPQAAIEYYFDQISHA
jgi:hypothetical protein